MNLMKMNLTKLNVIKLMLASLAMAGISAMALASPSKPEAGKEYQVITQAQPTDSKGKIEVTEFFFYTCPHCNVLDPFLAAWVKKQGDAIAFKRVPVDFGQGQELLRRLYYTLESMGKLEQLHSTIFKYIHKDRQPMFNEKDVVDFLKKNGIDEAKYKEISTSFTVDGKMKRAKVLQENYKIDSVPTLFVGGRYMTSPSLILTANPKMSETEGAEALTHVLDALVLTAKKDGAVKK